MTETQEKNYLDRLKSHVENKLEWGVSDDWRHSDYKNLSEVVYNESKILLSTSTLKRVWGKIKYEGMPNATTLDALSIFIGYTNWLDFKNKAKNKPNTVDETVPSTISSEVISKPDTTFPTNKLLAYAAVLVLMIVSIFILKSFVSVDQANTVEIPDNFVFEVAGTSVNGIPQTVMIDLDISGFDVDSLYLIEASRMKREYLNKNQKRHPYFCALPGTQTVTLMHGNQMIKQLKFFVRTKGWQAVTSEKDKGKYASWLVNLPTFLPSAPLENGFLTVSEKTLETHNVEVTENVWTSFYNFNDFDINSSDYSLTTRIRNSFEDGATTCQIAICSITTESGLHEVWLVAPGCSKFTHLLFGNGKMLDNKVVDLSEFEVDLNEWQNVAWKVEDKHVKVYINSKEVYNGNYDTDVGKITGLKYQFKGAGGKVDYLRLRDKEGNILYQDEFETEDLITAND